jgi:hypothetical protein
MFIIKTINCIYLYLSLAISNMDITEAILTL